MSPNHRHVECLYCKRYPEPFYIINIARVSEGVIINLLDAIVTIGKMFFSFVGDESVYLLLMHYSHTGLEGYLLEECPDCKLDSKHSLLGKESLRKISTTCYASAFSGLLFQL